jgi:glutathione S-transferase
MDALAAEQPGYVGIDSVRSPSGEGITVSYWADDAAARAWKARAEHVAAQTLGRERWYASYQLRVATVEREYAFERPIYHMAMPDDWAAAAAAGVYAMSTRGRSIAQEGFMHCSLATQMRGVAERFYADVDELTVLRLDLDRLRADIRFEPPADGIAELFPHLYRDLPVDAVTSVTTWQRPGDSWGEPPVDR